MSVETTEVLVIGAGAVGLAVARKMAEEGKAVVLVERHESYGRETSSRNSEVIHAGMYYPSGSLKATLCVEGNSQIYEWCMRKGVRYRRCGKLIIGTTPSEIENIESLYSQGIANGVQGLEWQTREQVLEREPDVSSEGGLWSPSTGIFDTHSFMHSLEHDAIERGATIAYDCTLKGITHASPYVAELLDSDGSLLQMRADIVVNSAGLASDSVAAFAGIDPDASGYRLQYCKGEYFRISAKHRNRLSHLVYPAPTKISLGIHTVLDLEGSLRLGPNAFYIDEAIDYSVDSTHVGGFYESAITYLPFIALEDLTPDQSGIRPKLQAEDEDFRDFVITEEKERGLPAFFNLVGIESPGLTASLAIADLVNAMISGRAD